jgi:sulfate adenylyltransferase subunit 1 (EFTu-like GTPase family)
LDVFSAIAGSGSGMFDPCLSLGPTGVAEREQGSSSNVAYTYFATSRRAFIVADTLGDEQHILRTVTGVSMSDVALLVIDACNGLLSQASEPQRHRQPV